MIRTSLAAAARAVRRALPEWLVPALAAASAPFPYAAAVRGALGVASPLLAGLLTGRPEVAVVVALGALWALNQDSSEAYGVRVRRITYTGATAALGLLLGGLAQRSGSGAAVVGCLAVLALVSGLVSPAGRLSSVVGMHLLLGAVIGSGLALPGPWWLPPLELLGGTAFLLGLSLLPWLWRRRQVERAAVLGIYRMAQEALAEAGGPGAEAARRRMTLALNHAHDLLSGHLGRGTADQADDATAPLLGAFHTAVRLAEAVTALVWEARPLPPEIRSVPQHIAARLLPPDGAAPRPHPPLAGFPQDTPGRRALAAVYTTAGTAREPVPAPHPPPRRSPSPAARLRFAALLTACVLGALLIAAGLHGPRGYWLPLSVAFIYKPDMGPLFGRALNRTLGTLAGVAVIGLVAVLTHDPYVLVVVVAACGALTAVGVRYHYALSTLALTAIVFVFLDFLGENESLFWTRIEDTAIAGALVLVAHFVVWPETWQARAQAQVDLALQATEYYVDEAQHVPVAARQVLRRTAYRALSEARHAAAHAHAEPYRPSRRPPDWDTLITEAERACDAVTARVVDSGTPHPGAPPDT
jgi:uncharacterized membrane protein YccC